MMLRDVCADAAAVPETASMMALVKLAWALWQRLNHCHAILFLRYNEKGNTWRETVVGFKAKEGKQ